MIRDGVIELRHPDEPDARVTVCLPMDLERFNKLIGPLGEQGWEFAHLVDRAHLEERDG